MMMNIPKRHLLLISLAFITVHLWLFLTIGVKVIGDSPRYLEWSSSLWQNGASISEWKFWYLGYVGFLSIFMKTGLGITGSIVAQVSLSFLAGLCLYNLAFQMTGQRVIGLWSVLMYICWVEILSWNMYVLTESLFTSMVVITTFVISRCEKNREQLLYALPLLLFTSLIRPMGIIFLIVVLLYFYHQLWQRQRLNLAWKAVLVLIPGLIVLYCGYLLIEANPTVNFYYAQGQVVWLGDLVEKYSGNSWLVVKSVNVQYPAPNQAAWRQFIEFADDNTSFFLELFWKKLTLFVIHVKPYYSTWHNILILCTLLPIYFFAGLGFVIHHGGNGMKLFVVGFFIANAWFTGMTVEPWDGRFLIPTLPGLMVLSAIGMYQFAHPYFRGSALDRWLNHTN